MFLKKSFRELKYALTHTPILPFPDYTDPFIICTDASTLGSGKELMQGDGRGKNHVTVYANRTINLTASIYFVSHLEILAVLWGLKQFRYIISGYDMTVH